MRTWHVSYKNAKSVVVVVKMDTGPSKTRSITFLQALPTFKVDAVGSHISISTLVLTFRGNDLRGSFGMRASDVSAIGFENAGWQIPIS